MNRLACWCGNRELLDFSPTYSRCPFCETLVSSQADQPEIVRVQEDEQQFYGREYWFSHQERDLNQPNILARARSDLPERCLHWLKALLKYQLPPARVLELGSAHGGFVALLRQVGFEAAGLELSPWVADFARETFGIPMLVGAIEQQDLPPASFEVVALMDVLEHLPDPLHTMRRAIDLIAADGFLLIQTPRYPEGKSYDRMVAEGDRFIEHLKTDEHLFLFSQSAISQFFGRFGVSHVAFEPAIFAHKDMFLAASRGPLRARTADEIEGALGTTIGGRVVQALLDLDRRARSLELRLEANEADEAARLAVITQQKEAIAALQSAVDGRFAESLKVVTRAGRRPSLLPRAVIRSTRRALEDLVSPKARLPTTSCHPDGSPNESRQPSHEPAHTQARAPQRIAVDLTQVLPGGENGGAKVAALAIVQALSRVAPEIDFLLLTCALSHDELAFLEAANVRRIRQPHADGSAPHPSSVVPVGSGATSGSIEVDLLFCPLTDPRTFHPAVPTVSVLYDLQFMAYPHFFSPQERAYRQMQLTRAAKFSDRIVCISDYVRGTLLSQTNVDPERVETIPLHHFHRLKRPTAERAAELLAELGLESDTFLLYPANFWAHKNHRTLLSAFDLYRARHPESRLKLVCTGHPGPRMDRLLDAARQMGLEPWVIFPGYVSDEQLAVLLDAADVVVFPSLYEGFGIPVVEAMAFGRPVACSTAASLPEIAQDAALYFDPINPADIANAIERLQVDSELRSLLIQRGERRSGEFGDPDWIARRYLEVFAMAAAGHRLPEYVISGIHADGWTSERMYAAYGSGEGPRYLELRFKLPEWFPGPHVIARVSSGADPGSVQYVIMPDDPLLIRHRLPEQAGYVEVSFAPVFEPRLHGTPEDPRVVGALCEACRVVSDSQVVDLLANSRGAP